MTISLGDMAQSFALRRQGGALKAEQQRLGSEMTTGLVADTGKHLRGAFSGIGAIDASLSRLEAYKGALTSAAMRAEGAQSVLSALTEMSDDLATLFSDPAMSGTAAGLNGAAADAGQRFRSAIGLLNSDVGGQQLFSGAATGPALADADTILAALEAATAGAATAAEFEAAVSAWFDDPAGYATVAWRGEGARAPSAIGTGESVAVDVTPMDPAIRDTLKALSMGALLDRGALDGKARSALGERVGAALIAGKDARIDLQTRVGAAEARIAQVQTRNEAERSALGIARNGMVAVDPYETAVRFEAVSTQIETLHAVTARLSKLSLVDFL
ncbi:flagellin [Falsirhodobacter xinxiangensis]|uniref:flagellin n=1 Tax=Falsirhodobacter xinxiangensis TaxID=2530049 RepID=UPI0010A9EB82|nr:flagellin [Rhodobacter xinxiangensis]